MFPFSSMYIDLVPNYFEATEFLELTPNKLENDYGILQHGVHILIGVPRDYCKDSFLY